MLSFLIRRILGAIPTLLLLCVVTFVTLRFAPGGPFDSDRALPPEVQLSLNIKYGLADPLPVQFAHWIEDALDGNLGESFQYIGRPVREIILESFPVSATLGAAALLFSLCLGIPLGCLAAWKQNTWVDASAMFIAVSGVSLPSYLVASLLVLVFALGLGWFPPALWESPSSLILPMVTLGFRPMAIVARLTRASMLEALQSEYIRTAHAKGVGAASILFRHALRNSIIPVITLLGPLAANLITGSFLVEVVFQIPGMGKHFVTAVLNRDYPLVMGVTLFYGVILMMANLVVDALYAWVDPRIRL